MNDRYDGEEEGDERLDEFLCEYVDGTMEAAARASFEEYLAQNPDLAAHVRGLVLTRSLLCSQRACAHAPSTLQRRLQIEIARDQLGTPADAVPVGGLGRFATFTSVVGFAVLLGAAVGTSFVRGSRPGDGDSSYVSRTEKRSVASDAHGHTGRIRPPHVAVASFGIIGPANIMPVLGSSRSMTPISGSDSLSAHALRRTGSVP